MTAGDGAARATAAFCGEWSGEAPLTWAQRLIWRAVHLMGSGESFLNCPWVLPVYGRCDLGTVLRALGGLLARHESLRTTFADTPDGPVQRVARQGELTVNLAEAGAQRPLEAAGHLAADLCRTAFAHGTELPVRCTVVTKDGRPAALAFAFSHLAVDVWALNLLSAEWRPLLRGETLPPPEWQPRHQAALETEEPYVRRGAKSVRYWREILQDAPLEVFSFPPGEAEDPRFVEVGMESIALAAAAERLAGRCEVTTTSVLTAACAVILATVNGRHRAVMQLVHGNRRDPRTQAMVGVAGLDGLFALDLPPESSFTDICRAAHRAALTAYRNAVYDPCEMQAMREEIGRLRGREPDLDAFFNDRRAIGNWPNLPEIGSDEEVATLTGKTRTYVAHAWPGVRFKAFFTMDTPADLARLHLITDTAYLTRAKAESLLRGVETLLVRSLTADIPLTAVAEVCGITPGR